MRRAWTPGKPPAPARAAGEARHCQGRSTGTFANESQLVRRPGGTSRASLARGPRSRAVSDGLTQRLDLWPRQVPIRTAPARGTERTPSQSTSCCLFVRIPWAAPRADSALERSPDPRLPAAPGRPSAPPRSLHAGSAPAAGQGRGAGRLPLGREVPGRLPPGVASGQGPRQQERDAGGPEEQSGPHDRRRRVPPGSAGLPRRARGRGLRPLAPPPGAAGSEPASPELARGAEQGAWGRGEEGPGAARGRGGRRVGVSGTSEPTHKRQRRPRADGLLGRRGALGGGKDQGPLGAGFRPRPTPPAGVWESASCEGLWASD